MKPKFTNKQPIVIYTRVKDKNIVFLESGGETLLPNYDNETEIQLIESSSQFPDSKEWDIY